jgi:peptidoglycan/LPS O-acetylase OafA/YrhL
LAEAGIIVALKAGKDIPLEALRGLAAITVLLWHTMLGFFPQRISTRAGSGS